MRQMICDGTLVFGAGVFSYGCWLAWHPLGFILGGLLIAIAAFLNGYRR